jgi:elongation factor Ts
MSTVSAAAVKSLRDRTNLPMMDCKSALLEANGDMDKAIEVLRTRFAKIQVSKGSRETAEGRISASIDSAQKVGALIEVRCESAPVAKSEPFVALANDLAKQVAVKNPKNVDELLTQPFVGDPKKTVNDRIGEVVGMIRENMRVARFTRLTGELGAYVHHDGNVGAMVQVEGAAGSGDPRRAPADAQLLKEICMHITFKNPLAARREDVPADLVAKETDIARKQIAADPKNQNKPANIIEKIAEGKMKTWFADNVLVDQPFIKDDSKAIGDLLKSAGLNLVRFVRYKVGEVS